MQIKFSSGSTKSYFDLVLNASIEQGKDSAFLQSIKKIFLDKNLTEDDNATDFTINKSDISKVIHELALA